MLRREPSKSHGLLKIELGTNLWLEPRGEDGLAVFGERHQPAIKKGVKMRAEKKAVKDI